MNGIKLNLILTSDNMVKGEPMMCGNVDMLCLPHERIVMKYLKAGVDIISFSGDKLVGGPQAGVICAKIFTDIL